MMDTESFKLQNGLIKVCLKRSPCVCEYTLSEATSKVNSH